MLPLSYTTWTWRQKTMNFKTPPTHKNATIVTYISSIFSFRSCIFNFVRSISYNNHSYQFLSAEIAFARYKQYPDIPWIPIYRAHTQTPSWSCYPNVVMSSGSDLSPAPSRSYASPNKTTRTHSPPRTRSYSPVSRYSWDEVSLGIHISIWFIYSLDERLIPLSSSIVAG